MRKTGLIACFALVLAITGIRAGPLPEATNGTNVENSGAPLNKTSPVAVTCRNDNDTACSPVFDGNADVTQNFTANATKTPVFDNIVGVIQNSTGTANVTQGHTAVERANATKTPVFDNIVGVIQNSTETANVTQGHTAVEWGCGDSASLAANQSATKCAAAAPANRTANCRNSTHCLNATATSGRSATGGTPRNATLRNDTVGEQLLNDEEFPRINETVDGDRSVCPPLVSLESWGGRPPLAVEFVRPSVPFVVIHHTYIPAACNDSRDCEAKMRQMQDFHMGKGWLNVGYNFVVGGDNRVYVGRGWDVVGAHSPVYNFKSVGISFIGDYRTELPTQEMLELAWSLIRCGVARGSIDEAYKLVGHRQVRDTECPGDRLYQEIQTWPHWVAHRDIIPRTNTTAKPRA